MARSGLDLSALNGAFSSAQISEHKEELTGPSHINDDDDGGGVQVTCFTEVVNESTFHLQIIRLPKQIYAWIGCNSATFGHLYAAAPMRPNSTVGVTSILGGASDNTGSVLERDFPQEEIPPQKLLTAILTFAESFSKVSQDNLPPQLCPGGVPAEDTPKLKIACLRIKHHDYSSFSTSLAVIRPLLRALGTSAITCPPLPLLLRSGVVIWARPLRPCISRGLFIMRNTFSLDILVHESKPHFILPLSGIAQRLVLDWTEHNLACNIPKNSPMLEADAIAEKLLVQKLINLGYTRPQSKGPSS